MPQLDFVIAFPQIFWLISIFFSLYMIIVHFFLPNFIKSLKARKQVVSENSETLISLEKDFLQKQIILNKFFETSFSKIKEMLEKEISSSFKETFLGNLNLIDVKVAKALYFNILYQDITILKSIKLNSNF